MSNKSLGQFTKATVLTALFGAVVLLGACSGGGEATGGGGASSGDGASALKRVYQDGKFKFVDAKNVPAFASAFEYARDFKGGVAAFFENGKWGLINEKGVIVQVPNCEFISDMHDGLSYCTEPNLTTSVVDPKGEVVAKTNFMFLRPLDDADSIFKGKNLMVGVDATKTIETRTYMTLYELATPKGEVLSPGFTDNYWVMDGRWLVFEGEKALWHFFDLNEKKSVMNPDGSGVLFVENNGDLLENIPLDGKKWTINVYKGEAIADDGTKKSVAKKWMSLSHKFFDEFEHAKSMDPKREECERESGAHFGELCTNDVGVEEMLGDLAAAAQNYCFVDARQNPVTFKEYQALRLAVCNEQYYMSDPQAVQAFVQDRAVVKKAGYWGVIDSTKKEIVPFSKYQDALPASEGMIPVMYDGKWGYIDLNGKSVIEPAYRSAERFFDGVASVELTDGRWMVIDKSGVPVVPGTPEKPMRFSSGLSQVDNPNGNLGNSNCPAIMIDKKGEFVDVGICFN